MIVVGTDGSRSAMACVRHAAELAARDQSPMTVVAAFRGRGESARGAAASALERSRSLCLELGVDPEVVAMGGRPSQVLCRVAREREALMIVVGNRGTGDLVSSVQRPVCKRVARMAQCDVIVVDTRDHWTHIDEASRALALEFAEPMVLRIDRPSPGPRLYLTGLRIHHGLLGEVLAFDAMRRRGRMRFIEAAIGLLLFLEDRHDFPFSLIDR